MKKLQGATNYKKEILVVFNPYVVKGKPRPYRYRCISANSLGDYIGSDIDNPRLNKFLNSGLQKDNFYIKQCGKVYLYRNNRNRPLRHDNLFRLTFYRYDSKRLLDRIFKN